MIKILILGEIVGISTSYVINKNMQNIKEKYNIDFVVANVDGASDGYGVLSKTAYFLNKYGINVLTTGDFVFNKKDVKTLLRFPFLLRPYNLPGHLGGRGSMIYQVGDDIKIGIISILGRTNLNKLFPTDPYYAVNKVIDKIKDEVQVIIVDFHGGATSEIQAMHWYLAGKVSIVYGSHLRVMTTDNRILDDKTAVITGTGFCGGKNSIGGLASDIEIQKFKNGQFIYSKIEKENIQMQGIIVECDEETGKAVSVELFKEDVMDKDEQ